MSPTSSFVQPDFVRWLISDGFVMQSKRALTNSTNSLLYLCFFMAQALYFYLIVPSILNSQKCFRRRGGSTSFDKKSQEQEQQ